MTGHAFPDVFRLYLKTMLPIVETALWFKVTKLLKKWFLLIMCANIWHQNYPYMEILRSWKQRY